MNKTIKNELTWVYIDPDNHLVTVSESKLISLIKNKKLLENTQFQVKGTSRWYELSYSDEFLSSLKSEVGNESYEALVNAPSNLKINSLRVVRAFFGLMFSLSVISLWPLITWVGNLQLVTGNMIALLTFKVMWIILFGWSFSRLRDYINKTYREQTKSNMELIKSNIAL